MRHFRITGVLEDQRLYVLKCLWGFLLSQKAIRLLKYGAGQNFGDDFRLQGSRLKQT